MPVQHAIWKIGSAPALLNPTMLESKQQLEDMIVQDSRILSAESMLRGRQKTNEANRRMPCGWGI